MPSKPLDRHAINSHAHTILHLSECTRRTGGALDEQGRRELIAAAQSIIEAASSPEERLFAIAQQPAQNAALRCAIALKIPSLLPLDGTPRGLDELVAATKASKALLRRLLRACTTTGLFLQSSEDHYAHNDLSKPLVSAANRALMTLMFDYNGRAVIALPEFLAQRNWQHSGTYEDSAFMMGSRTNLPMWEYRDSDEECRKTFDSGMESEIVADIARSRSSSQGPFDFDQAFSTIENSVGDSRLVTLVDVGGGHGQAIKQLHEDYPKVKGRFIVMDLAPAIEAAKANGLPHYIEPLVGSFFEPFEIRGALIYYIRRVLHNWNDEACCTILGHVKNAMDPKHSRLLIVDMVYPDVGAPREAAWEDLNMMTIGGAERTEKDWHGLLKWCGLHIHTIWKTSDMDHAVIDARLELW